MDFYMMQDFSPPILSRRWIAIKCRPNMLIYNRQHIISILESGLLFREDSVEVEQEAPSPEEVWSVAGGCRGGWLTGGEGAVSACALAACVAVFPVRSMSRWSLVNVAAYASVPVLVRAAHRVRCRAALSDMLANMRDYLTLARRAAAALKEYTALYTQLASVMSVAESLHTLLCRQQGELCARAARASAAVLVAAPWLRCEPVTSRAVTAPANLTQIHHAFLVYQSTLLKNIALAHCIPSPHLRKLYRNHNERIYWIHNVVIKELNEEIKENLEALQRMYRLLKNSTTRDNDAKKLGAAINKNWLYSDVHNGVARVCLELKLALNKSNSLDMFLDSCAMNDEEFDLNMLNKDIDGLIDNMTKCLSTLQSSQIRLKKLKGKSEAPAQTSEENLVESAAILKIEDKEPETKDEVFYFVKTDDDDVDIQPAGDSTTAPGKKEKETTKIVLCELKRKLGKREDVMRERERQALGKTMPDLKVIPEFPRQIKFDEFCERKGFITKIKREPKKKKLCLRYKIECKPKEKYKKYKINFQKYFQESDLKDDYLEANSHLNVKSRLITVSSRNKMFYLTRWYKVQPPKKSSKYFDSSGMSDGLSDVEAGTVNKTTNQAVNNDINQTDGLAVNNDGAVNQAVNANDLKIKFSKKDLELSASSSDSDTEYYQEQRQLLKDVRRHRVARRKNHPNYKVKTDVGQRSTDNVDRGTPTTDNVDESLKPIEYSFGTGLAMASVLQVNNPRLLNMAEEEVFVGDGEVSNDSGNDEDA